MSSARLRRGPVETRRSTQPNGKRYVQTTRCNVCGADLDGRGGSDEAACLAQHLRQSPGCREAIRAWLDARGEP